MRYIEFFINNADNIPKDFGIYNRDYLYDPWQNFCDVKINGKKYKFTDKISHLGPYNPDNHNTILCINNYYLLQKFIHNDPDNYRFFLPISLNNIISNNYSNTAIYIFSNINSNNTELIHSKFKHKKLSDKYKVLTVFSKKSPASLGGV